MSTTVLIPERVERLRSVIPAVGAHSTPPNGDVVGCEVELLSWAAGMPWSDHTPCISPVVATFLRSWNDSLDEPGRERLHQRCLGLIEMITSTGGDGHDEARGWLAADWLVRVCTPTWLELAGITESSAALRALAPLASPATFRAASDPLVRARKDGAAARAAARDAAWAAARDAVWDAVWDAARAAARAAAGAAAWDSARAAARDAAWAAAGAAAWDSARAAAWAAARDAARAAAGAAAWDAAWAAARDAAGAAAGAAARAAARDALEPTKISLQGSALDLLGRMVSIGKAV